MTKHKNKPLALILLSLALMPHALADSQAFSYAWTTYMGGAAEDLEGDIAVASDGDLVFCATSRSSNLATPGAYQLQPTGGQDVLVGRISGDGSALRFATYVGGTVLDQCNRVALDSNDNIVVAGVTESSDFPAVNALDSTFGGGGFGSDGFVFKLSADGSTLVFSTYVGGEDLSTSQTPARIGRGTVRGLFVDGDDRIYFAGNTSAADFPATTILHDRSCGDDAVGPGLSIFVTDAIVGRFAPDGTLDFATCFGGTARDTGRAVTVDATGNIVMLGATRSEDYPVTAGALDTGYTGNAYNGAVVVFNPDATQILHAARFGGPASDFFQDVQLDSTGNLVISGTTVGLGFPTTPGAWQSESAHTTVPDDINSIRDVMVLKLTPDLASLEFSTLVSGVGEDDSLGLTLDDDKPVVAVQTTSWELPTRFGKPAARALSIQEPEPLGPESGVTAFASGRITPSEETGFLVTVGPGDNRLYIESPDGGFELARDLDEGGLDTRDVAILDINLDSYDDIVTANYEGENQLYLNDTAGGFLPAVSFGSPLVKTTGIGWLMRNGVPCVVEFAENGANIQHDYAFGFLGPFTIDPAATSSRDVAQLQFGGAIAEISGPDTITIYGECAIPGEGVATTAQSYAGRDLVALAFGEVSGSGQFNDLLVADANGGGFVVPGATEPLALNAELPFFADAPVGIADLGGPSFVVAGADGLEEFSLEDSGEVVFRGAVSSAEPITGVHFPQARVGGVAVATASGTGWSASGGGDIYLIRLNSDGTDASFATYFGGPGPETVSFGIERTGAGRYALFGDSRSLSVPTTPGVLQPAPAGGADLVLTELALGDLDGDGALDVEDNCLEQPNADQRDTNEDGFGNRCDPDLNNDGVVNVVDLGIFRAAFFSNPDSDEWNPEADFDGDDVVNVVDLGIMRAFFFGPPGPVLD